MRTVRIRQGLAVLCGVLLLGAAAACGDDDSGGTAADDTDTTAAASGVEGKITVFAAASLTDAFGDIKEAFEQANPDATVTFNFAASSALREQILADAPADVFASANTSNMDQVVDGGKADGDPQIFVQNRLEIAVPDGNPGGVEGLDAFGDDALLIGLCAEEVPCGEFGREALDKAGVTPKPDTNEPDVRALLTKVQAGDLDAGLVYQTDVTAAGSTVDGIEIADDQNIVADYPIAALSGSENAEAAQAFVGFVLSDEGQQILEKRGFIVG